MTARIMHGNEQTLYRAVIVTTVPATPEHTTSWGQIVPAAPERVTTSYAGPFGSRRAASGAIGRARHNRQYESSYRIARGALGEITVTGQVEETTLNWKPVVK